MGGEQLEAAGPQRYSLQPGDEGVHVVTHPPLRQPARQRAISRAPAATWRRTWASRARCVFRTSSSSVSEYHGCARPASSSVTWPPPWSRTRPMKVAPLRNSDMASLWASPPVKGNADAPVPGAYWVASIRKP